MRPDVNIRVPFNRGIGLGGTLAGIGPTKLIQNLSPTYGVPTVDLTGRRVTHGAGVGPYPNIAYANNGKNTGKYVFAIRINANMTGGASNTVYMGLTASVGGGAYIYLDSVAPGTFGNGSANNVNPVGMALASINRVYMFAVDFTESKVWVGWDGTFNGIPETGTTPAFTLTAPPLLYPWIQENYADTDVEYLFSSTDYPYAVPSGFSTWDA